MSNAATNNVWTESFPTDASEDTVNRNKLDCCWDDFAASMEAVMRNMVSGFLFCCATRTKRHKQILPDIKVLPVIK